MWMGFVPREGHNLDNPGLLSPGEVESQSKRAPEVALLSRQRLPPLVERPPGLLGMDAPLSEGLKAPGYSD